MRGARPAAFNTDRYWEGFWADPAPNLMDIGRHLILPVITLVAVSVAGDSRFVRSSMMDTLSQDFIRTARAKGLPRRQVVFHHAFRNAMHPHPDDDVAEHRLPLLRRRS